MPIPKIPGHTCPLIDNVQQAIERAFAIAYRAEDSPDIETFIVAMREIQWELRGLADKLEPIRDANLALRNAAEYWQEEAEKLASKAIREATGGNEE
jgi:hypothetical protein